MRIRGARLVLASCVVFSAACGLSGSGLGVGPLSGDDGSADGGVEALPDATGSDAIAPEDAPPSVQGMDSASADEGAAVGHDSGGELEASAQDAGGAGDSAAGADSAASDAAGAADAADATDATDATDAADTGSAGDASGAADAGLACLDAGTCIVVPSGWSLVAFAPDQTSACPSGFGQSTNLVEGPSATSACACGTCTVSTQPSCASGPIQVFYDNVTSSTAGTCDLPGTVTPLGNASPGTCLTDIYQGSYAPYDTKYVPSGPSGGVCTSPGATEPGSVTYTAQDRTCTPSSAQSAGCTGNVCSPNLGGSYTACITAPGAVACPPGPLSVQHVVGTGTTFDCSACTCTVAGDCTGTVTLYSDTSCRHNACPVPADGSCNGILGLATGTTYFQAYIYTGNAPTNVGCESSGSSTASNVALTGETTICCAP